jgi:exodeoxyribonuclease-1
LNDPETFLWYDFETFGSDPATTRIAQCAAIRTDATASQILDEQVWYCRAVPDFLPDPIACAVTGLTPPLVNARDDALTEPAFAARLLRVLNQPGTCWVGYNNVRFDDACLRYLLHRNLLDPFAHENRPDTSRWDLLDVLRLAYAFRPEGIEWPTRADDPEAPSFKLEDLAAANAIAQPRAHDARSDVLALIALARLVRARQPRLFAYALDLRTPARVDALLSARAHREPLWLISPFVPASQGHLSPVVVLGKRPGRRNEWLALDLREPVARFLETPLETLHQWRFCPEVSLPESAYRPPVRTISVKKTPMLANWAAIGATDPARFALDLDAIQSQFAVAQRYRDELRDKVAALLAHGEAGFAEQTRDAEIALYGAFPSSRDRALLAAAWQAAPATGPDAAALQTLETALEQPTLRELAFRMRARWYPESLSDDDATRWAQLRCARVCHGAAGAPLARATFRDRFAQAAAALSKERRAELVAWEIEASAGCDCATTAAEATVFPPVDA